MSTPHALFVTVLEPNEPLDPQNKTVDAQKVRKIFHYFNAEWPRNMYVFILDDDQLEALKLQKDSNAMTRDVIEPIIAPLLPQGAKYQWAIVPLSELLTWPSPPANVTDLLTDLSGASGGGQG